MPPKTARYNSTSIHHKANEGADTPQKIGLVHIYQVATGYIRMHQVAPLIPRDCHGGFRGGVMLLRLLVVFMTLIYWGSGRLVPLIVLGVQYRTPIL